MNINREMKELFDEMFEGVLMANKEGRVIYWSGVCTEIIGFTSEEAIGENHMNLLFSLEENKKNIHFPLGKTFLDGKTRVEEVLVYHKNGYKVPLKAKSTAIMNMSGDIMGVVLFFIEILETEAERRSKPLDINSEKEIDRETSFPNKEFLTKMLYEAENKNLRNIEEFGVVKIEIPNLKEIESNHSKAGEVLILKAVAQRIQRTLRPNDIYGRWERDSFLLLFKKVSEKELKVIEDKISTALADISICYNKETILAELIISSSLSKEGEDFNKVLLNLKPISN